MWIGDVHWNRRSIDHIARHGVEPDEVEEVVFGRAFHVVRADDERYLLIGQTQGGRYLSVIVEPEGAGVYYVVTARDATPRERRLLERHRTRR